MCAGVCGVCVCVCVCNLLYMQDWGHAFSQFHAGGRSTSLGLRPTKLPVMWGRSWPLRCTCSIQICDIIHRVCFALLNLLNILACAIPNEPSVGEQLTDCRDKCSSRHRARKCPCVLCLQQCGQSGVSTSESLQVTGPCHFRGQCFCLGPQSRVSYTSARVTEEAAQQKVVGSIDGLPSQVSRL